MKLKTKLYSLLLILFGCLAITACGSDNDDPEPPVEPEGVLVKVMSYNIYSGQLKGMNAIADVINAVDPDLVGLQEFETQSSKAPGDMVQFFLDNTDMQYAYFDKNRNLSPGEYGNLILSKYPISEQISYPLTVDFSDGGTIYPRSIGIVKVEKEGKAFYFADTHFDHISNDANRLIEAEEVISYTQDTYQPIIMVGDFNCLKDSEPMKILTEWYTIGCLNDNCGLTTGTPSPTKAIDFALYAPTGAVTPKAYSVYYDAYTESDHFPVVATFNVHK